MPENMEFFRNQMFQNAAATGNAGSDRMLTPASVASSEKKEALNKALDQLLTAAESRGEVDRKDPLFKELVGYFILKANTQDGRERALSLAISVSRRLHQVFDITLKVQNEKK